MLAGLQHMLLVLWRAQCSKLHHWQQNMVENSEHFPVPEIRALKLYSIWLDPFTVT